MLQREAKSRSYEVPLNQSGRADGQTPEQSTRQGKELLQMRGRINYNARLGCVRLAGESQIGQVGISD
jgi:hypothetical protein